MDLMKLELSPASHDRWQAVTTLGFASLFIINIVFDIVLNIISFYELNIHLKAQCHPAERCDFVSVKLEKVHELFQVCRIGGKGVVFYNMAQYGILLYHKSLCD